MTRSLILSRSRSCSLSFVCLRICQVPRQVETRLTALLANGTDPLTSRTLKAVALATYEPILAGERQTRSRHWDGIGVVAQISGVRLHRSATWALSGYQSSASRLFGSKGVAGTKRQHPMYKWRKVFAGNRTSPQRRDVVAKASPPTLPNARARPGTEFALRCHDACGRI
jgi:hypothetical protein